MTNHSRKLLSLSISCCLGVFFTSQVSAATFNVSTSGNGTITLTSADDNLSITGSGGEISYSLGDESGILSGVRRLSIVARGGDNVISLEQLQLEQDLTIRMAGGTDDISVTDSDIGGRLSIVTRGGADEVSLINTTVSGSGSVNTGGGDDEVSISGVTVESALVLVTSIGDDTVEIASSQLNNRANISTAGGADSIEMDNVTVEGRMTMATSTGSDKVKLNENTFNNVLSVNTGGNDDELTVTGNSGSLRTILDGSGGRGDVYRQDENNVFGSPFVFRGFETEEIVDANAQQTFAIGDTGPGGGIVFSVSADGTSGLEAAPEDQSNAVQWCNSFTDITGVENLSDLTISDPNTGAENTPLIMEACGESSAAGVAAAYKWPNGQTDGFLPNREELDLLFNQRTVVGGFVGGLYWSSSEFDLNFAWVQLFSGGDRGDSSKFNALRVRAVRAF